MAKEKYKVLSLFTGAMGLDLGLEQTGNFRLLACVENQKSFCETIRLNRDKKRIGSKDTIVYEADIAGLDPKQVLNDLNLEPGEIDLIAGGPPCQSYSCAGKRGTVQDPRGSLLWCFLRFVSVIRPKTFIIENVRGLQSAALEHRPIKDRPEKGGKPLAPEEQPGSVLRLFIRDLRHRVPEYRMDAFLVNAVNYGAPQLRERLIIIGNRYGLKANFPDPTHAQRVTDKELDKLPFATLADAIRGVSEINPVIMDFSERKKNYLAMVPEGSNWRSLPKSVQLESMGKAFFAKGGRSGWWRRLTWDLPCPTLVTMPNHASTSLCHPEEIRALTLREYALIQQFPPDWEFCGKVQEQYAQAGNAVPVRLGNIAGTVVANLLKQATSKKNSKEVHEDFTMEYICSHVRTRNWFKKGDVFVWNHSQEDNEDNLYAKMKTERAIRVL